ncbi:hypothetical protein [Bizionia sp.]|uniref:hypothetical protein n=1 Tax=Bizionia sp. TaxID=1954480 RepID=UPI003A923053
MKTELIMIIEDIYSIIGMGTIVTGQLQCDEINIDEAIIIDPEYLPEFASKIIGIETFRKKRKSANLHEYVGLTLQGVEKKQLRKGVKIFKTKT